MERHPKSAVCREQCGSPSELTSEEEGGVGIHGAGLIEPTARLPETQTNFPILMVNDLKQLSDPAWLIDDILPQGAFAVLYGAPAAGKSFLALDWANSVATGKQWFGRTVKAMDVVYVAAEGVRGLWPRIRAWQQARGASPERIRFVPKCVDFLDMNVVGKLIDDFEMVRLCPGLIVIDTLARCFIGGDENAAKDMSAFVNNVDELRAVFPGATILVLHHSGKAKGKGLRGHSALLGAADTVLCLSKTYGVLKLSCQKQKDADEFNDLTASLVSVDLGQGHTSCVMEPMWSAAKVPLSKDAASTDLRTLESNKKARDALAKFGTAGASFSQWETASGLKRSTFKDTRARLIQRKEVVKEGKKYRVASVGPRAETGSK